MSNYIEIDQVIPQNVSLNDGETKTITGSTKKYTNYKILYSYQQNSASRALSVLLPEVSCPGGLYKNKEGTSLFCYIKLNVTENNEHKNAYLKLYEIYREICSKFCVKNKKKFDTKAPYKSSGLTYCILEDAESPDEIDLKNCDDNGCKTIFTKLFYYQNKVGTTFVGINNKQIDATKLFKIDLKMIPVLHFTKVFFSKNVTKIFVTLKSALITEMKPRERVNFTSQIDKYLSKKPDALNDFEKNFSAIENSVNTDNDSNEFKSSASYKEDSNFSDDEADLVKEIKTFKNSIEDDAS